MPSWKKMCEELQIPDEIMQLEDAISQHQALIESVSQVYTEVVFNSLYVTHHGKSRILSPKIKICFIFSWDSML